MLKWSAKVACGGSGLPSCKFPFVVGRRALMKVKRFRTGDVGCASLPEWLKRTNGNALACFTYIRWKLGSTWSGCLLNSCDGTTACDHAPRCSHKKTIWPVGISAAILFIQVLFALFTEDVDLVSVRPVVKSLGLMFEEVNLSLSFLICRLGIDLVRAR